MRCRRGVTAKLLSLVTTSQIPSRREVPSADPVTLHFRTAGGLVQCRTSGVENASTIPAVIPLRGVVEGFGDSRALDALRVARESRQVSAKPCFARMSCRGDVRWALGGSRPLAPKVREPVDLRSRIASQDGFTVIVSPLREPESENIVLKYRNSSTTQRRFSAQYCASPGTNVSSKPSHYR